jgi:hypothetical protein
MSKIKLKELFDKVEDKLNKTKDPIDVLGVMVPAGTAARSMSKEKWEELFTEQIGILLGEQILKPLDEGVGDDKEYEIVHIEESIWNIFDKL